MQGRFKMEYRLFTIVRYNYNYRDYNNRITYNKDIMFNLVCNVRGSSSRSTAENGDKIWWRATGKALVKKSAMLMVL